MANNVLVKIGPPWLPQDFNKEDEFFFAKQLFFIIEFRVNLIILFFHQN